MSPKQAKIQFKPVAPSDPPALAPALIDELGQLERDMAPFSLKLARIQAIRKTIREHYDSAPAANAYQGRGTRFLVAVGERANETEIDIGRLAKAITMKAFLKFATTSLKALKEHCSPAVVAAVTSTAQTGCRSLRTFEIPQGG